MNWQLDTSGGETPHEHVVAEVAPGDKCPTCERRVPHPKKADSPQSKVFAYRVPLDDAETHGEILDAAATELGIFSEPHHRFKLALYGATLILQGARLDETGG